MKKLLEVIIFGITVFILVGCQGDVNSPLVISKVYGASSQRNNLIELYNPSDESIDLSNYKLNFYINGAEVSTNSIGLSGVIESNGYYIVGSSNNNESSVTGLVDFSYLEGSLPFNGNDAIELALGSSRIDVVGTIGVDVDFARNITLIRIGDKADYQPSKTFDMYNFIYYAPDVFQYVKNDTYEIKTLADLYAGPRLEQRYKEMPYINPNNENTGGGGAVATTNTSIADGDTAYFAASNGFGGGSVRYYYINTPEVDGGYVNAEPWGYVASKYNKEYLLKDASSKEIYIQSLPGGALKESNNRSLALVWVNGHLSQFLIVAEGLTEDVSVMFDSIDVSLTYKNVPYLTFLRFAEKRAKDNGWGTKGYPGNPNGEKSPDWNYQANKNSTYNPIWTPHLAIPWA